MIKKLIDLCKKIFSKKTKVKKKDNDDDGQDIYPLY